ncbi:MAG: hypothetical protein RLZZ364_1142, partial [Actinomycetota bacterium]
SSAIVGSEIDLHTAGDLGIRGRHEDVVVGQVELRLSNKAHGASLMARPEPRE